MSITNTALLFGVVTFLGVTTVCLAEPGLPPSAERRSRGTFGDSPRAHPKNGYPVAPPSPPTPLTTPPAPPADCFDPDGYEGCVDAEFASLVDLATTGRSTEPGDVTAWNCMELFCIAP